MTEYEKMVAKVGEDVVQAYAEAIQGSCFAPDPADYGLDDYDDEMDMIVAVEAENCMDCGWFDLQPEMEGRMDGWYCWRCAQDLEDEE